jgi:hypothetical protein
MTTWTGTRDSSRRFCTRVAGPCGPLLHSLRDGGASRSAPRAGSLIIVLHPVTCARNAAVKGDSSLTVTTSSSARARLPAVRAGFRIWFNRQVTVQIGHSVVSGEQVHILKAHWAPSLARVPPDRAGQSWFSAVRIPVCACWPSRSKAGLSSGARRRYGPLKMNSAA